MRNNRITGQDYQLNWGDFRAPAPRNPGSRVAFTSASFSINFTINSNDEPLDPAVARALPRTTGRPGAAAPRGTVPVPATLLPIFQKYNLELLGPPLAARSAVASSAAD